MPDRADSIRSLRAAKTQYDEGFVPIRDPNDPRFGTTAPTGAVLPGPVGPPPPAPAPQWKKPERPKPIGGPAGKPASEPTPTSRPPSAPPREPKPKTPAPQSSSDQPVSSRPKMVEAPPAGPPPDATKFFHEPDTKSLRDDIARYYEGIPGGVDARIQAAARNIANRPAGLDMSMFGTPSVGDYSKPIPWDNRDPSSKFGGPTVAYRRRDDGDVVHMSPLYFTKNGDTVRGYSKDMGWDETLAHERTHVVADDDSGADPLAVNNDFLKVYGDNYYPLMPTEISTRGAEIGRLYSLYKGVPVNTHEDAREALHWFIQNQDQIKKDGHLPLADKIDAETYLKLPPEKKLQVLQRMTEVAGVNQFRRSLS